MLSTGVRLTTCVGQDSRTWCGLANLASRTRLAATAMTAVDLRMRCTLSHPWRQASRWTIKTTLEATDSIKLGHWTLYCHSVPKWQLQGDCRYLHYPPLLPRLPTCPPLPSLTIRCLRLPQVIFTEFSAAIIIDAAGAFSCSHRIPTRPVLCSPAPHHRSALPCSAANHMCHHVA